MSQFGTTENCISAKESNVLLQMQQDYNLKVP